jgi:hypothetical protein
MPCNQVSLQIKVFVFLGFSYKTIWHVLFLVKDLCRRFSYENSYKNVSLPFFSLSQAFWPTAAHPSFDEADVDGWSSMSSSSSWGPGGRHLHMFKLRSDLEKTVFFGNSTYTLKLLMFFFRSLQLQRKGMIPVLVKIRHK